jgi:hypothetical protein
MTTAMHLGLEVNEEGMVRIHQSGRENNGYR